MAWNWKPGIPADDVRLTAATVAFRTNDEDKDGDTKVTVVVRNWDRTEVARVSDCFGHFDDNHDNGPFPLFILNQTTVDRLKESRGEVAIHIDPNGHDTWHFNGDALLAPGEMKFTGDIGASDIDSFGGYEIGAYPYNPGDQIYNLVAPTSSATSTWHGGPYICIDATP